MRRVFSIVICNTGAAIFSEKTVSLSDVTKTEEQQNVQLGDKPLVMMKTVKKVIAYIMFTEQSKRTVISRHSATSEV